MKIIGTSEFSFVKLRLKSSCSLMHEWFFTPKTSKYRILSLRERERERERERKRERERQREIVCCDQRPQHLKGHRSKKFWQPWKTPVNGTGQKWTNRYII